MRAEPELGTVAALFRVLGTESRLRLLWLLIERGPHTVGQLADESALTQPLVSQHLRVLRGAALVVVQRTGKQALYRVSDDHVAHVVVDAINHTHEHTDSPNDQRGALA